MAGDTSSSCTYDMMTINVGGTTYVTSRDTLLKGETMLSKMFSGRFKIGKDPNGDPFIDRDGTHFRHILNYLRSGRCSLPQDVTILEELQIEADYYQISGLSYLIELELKKAMRMQYCKVLCSGDWIGQLNYLVDKGWEIYKFITETESKYRELDDYGKQLKNGIGWYDTQTQCILLKKPLPPIPL
ncbi:hypothetical protein PROFUN_03288 [Planoprotostelium fungivorum]|uniref:BTB domain-containing protein n=1 Tax=Planoprotostelium fungivorum TaxID=1890364 RepID=A0A2P6NWN3_9EUKA|nr:hypothetical protein PROFUN_03288 [Planoprotostelium fungivorum]